MAGDEVGKRLFNGTTHCNLPVLIDWYVEDGNWLKWLLVRLKTKYLGFTLA